MGVWSRELVRRAFEWHYSRGPERTTFFLHFFFILHFSHLEKHRCFLDTCHSCTCESGVCIYLWTEREGEREGESYMCIYIVVACNVAVGHSLLSNLAAREVMA